MINFYFAYEYVHDEILKSVERGEVDEEGFLLSEKEYCTRFDVSLTTVRRALQHLKEEGIVEKIKGKGTRLSRLVRRVNIPPNKFIGVLMMPFSKQPPVHAEKYHYVNNYAQRIYQTIYRELKEEYNLLLDSISMKELEERFPQSVLKNADKILLLGETQREAIDYLQAQGKCVLVYNYFECDVRVCRVNNDERAQYRKAVDYLLKNGHKRIACINGFIDFSESLERYMGYQDSMIVNNQYIDAEYVRWCDMTPEGGYREAKKLMKLSLPPTAIICVNDGVAMGTYDAICEAGYQVGKDVVLVGHDNSELEDKKYVFSTIDPQYDKVGKCLADKLRKNIWIDDETVCESKLVIR